MKILTFCFGKINFCFGTQVFSFGIFEEIQIPLKTNSSRHEKWCLLAPHVPQTEIQRSGISNIAILSPSHTESRIRGSGPFRTKELWWRGRWAMRPAVSISKAHSGRTCVCFCVWCSVCSWNRTRELPDDRLDCSLHPLVKVLRIDDRNSLSEVRSTHSNGNADGPTFHREGF